MLKTQITGAKYLSPQTNQMTNLNIAVPADSKDTEFGTSDILLAKDVVAYLNALDSDISKDLTAAIEQNDVEHKEIFSGISSNTSKITKLNKTVKQLVDHNLIKIVTELPTTDIDKNCIYLVPNKDGEGNNVFVEYIYVEAKNTFEEVGRIQAKVDLSDYYTKEQTDSQIEMAKNSAINIHNEDNKKYIKLDINDTEAAGEDDQNSTVNASLVDLSNGCTVGINARGGFTHNTDNGCTSNLDGYGLSINDGTYGTQILSNQTTLSVNDSTIISLNVFDEGSQITLGNDKKFKIFRPGDNTEGATITGVESITAFSNPSSTKVFATDGSIADLSTKADASDFEQHAVWTKGAGENSIITVACKEDIGEDKTRGAIGKYSVVIGSYATASGVSSYAEGGATVASGDYSHAENAQTEARGYGSHAEGSASLASGLISHAEGSATVASGAGSHTEGNQTEASGFCAHAQGTYNIIDNNAIHSIGIGNDAVRKNAEYIYTKNNESGTALEDDPKNGYKYLIGVGGYDGISTDNTTYKSVQEVIADLTARIEQLETKVKALEDANTPA